jgi:hypothetical protein
MRWMRHRTIILVNAIMYFNCIIATTIIAMGYYNYHTRFHIPTVVVLMTEYYTITTNTTITIITTTILSIGHTCHLHFT